MVSDDVKQSARDFFAQIWNNRDESAIDRFVPVNAMGNEDDFGSTREGFRSHWRAWMAAFPDLHFELGDIISEGNQVLTRWTITGTHTGASFLGVEPTGVKINVSGMSFDRIENGMCVEGIDGWDALGLRRQLGLYDGE